MKLTGRSGINVEGESPDYLVSKNAGVITVGGVQSAPFDPFRNIGFYSYASGDAVVIAKGQVIVRFPGSEGGGFSYLDTFIPLTTFTDLTPGTEGYIVWRYAQSLTTQGVSTIASDQDIDFGDPSANYIMTVEGETYFTGGESNSVNGSRYAYVFLGEQPEPSQLFFNQIICYVSVNTFGIPTVRPIHIGDINVPLGLKAVVSDTLVIEND